VTSFFVYLVSLLPLFIDKRSVIPLKNTEYIVTSELSISPEDPVRNYVAGTQNITEQIVFGVEITAGLRVSVVFLSLSWRVPEFVSRNTRRPLPSCFFHLITLHNQPSVTRFEIYTAVKIHVDVL
jgi:hypothetical protein